MIKQYFKQALQMLKENPLVNTISVLGTALSIAMILVLVLVFQINTTGYPPEENRDRMLYMLAMRSSNGSQGYGGYMSEEVVKECLYTLQTPEAVTAFSVNEKPVCLPSERLFAEYHVTYTDPGFWKVFNFSFLEGIPFSEADFQSEIPRAVISAQLASKLFGTVNATGKQVILDNILFTVSGVVKSVSEAANHAYAEIWVPYTINPSLRTGKQAEGTTGTFQAVLLAKSKSDFDNIRDEINQQLERYNDSKAEFKINFLENPFTRLEVAINGHGFAKKPIAQYLLTTGAILLFLLLIPALNLIGVVQSSVQKRRAEMGIRKAFGATKGIMMLQVLSENLVITVMGGFIGLGLSLFFIHAFKSFLLTDTTLLTAQMLFQPGLFLAVVFFALLLNLLSASIPAIRISRQTIVNALNETEL